MIMLMAKQKINKYWQFTLRKRKISVLLDKVLLFRYLQRLHGRFWGIAGLLGLGIGFSICFAIRPELRSWSTAFSDFGDDIRTAPYFTAAVFMAAYGLWRWRNYLRRTLKHPRPMIGLLSLTIFGLLLVVFMPIAWKPIPYYIHLFGVSLVGISIVLTVVLDGLLSKTRKTKHLRNWRITRFISFWMIIIGGWITLGSVEDIGLYDIAGVGELLMIAGYGLWIIVKTYHGDGGRTTLSKMLRSFVLID
jgi:hypothetical protein